MKREEEKVSSQEKFLTEKEQELEEKLKEI